MLLTQQILNGLVLGATYSLIALSLTLLIGVLGQLNMAAGETLMFGGFVGLVLMTGVGAPFVVALLGAMAAGAGIAVLTYFLSFKFVKAAYPTAPVLSTVGVGILLSSTASEIWSSESRGFPEAVPNKVFDLGFVEVTLPQILVFCIAVATMVALQALIHRTSLGLALRAVSERPATSALLGIPVQRIVIATFVISGCLVGAAGVLTGLTVHTISPYIGMDATLKGLAIMVLGGLGNVTGAVAAGFLIGVLEVLSVAYVSANFRNAFAFIVLIAVLTLRPQGLFGTRTRETRV
ncbi:branched-chain amino acid ABC transporter permease [Nocardioides sp.]|uniref:branched-chain amino acid ABC transporter permease n=1 Tax=Nocardioides sp. TaxID=35761 RepID=UPI0039E64AB1